LRARREITPLLSGAKFGSVRFERILTGAWSLADGKSLNLLANLANAGAEAPRGFRLGRSIWGGEPADKLPPWSVFWGIGEG
jgi:maltooligosyltrehalose trehalohydrolase